MTECILVFTASQNSEGKSESEGWLKTADYEQSLFFRTDKSILRVLAARLPSDLNLRLLVKVETSICLNPLTAEEVLFTAKKCWWIKGVVNYDPWLERVCEYFILLTPPCTAHALKRGKIQFIHKGRSIDRGWIHHLHHQQHWQQCTILLFCCCQFTPLSSCCCIRNKKEKFISIATFCLLIFNVNSHSFLLTVFLVSFLPTQRPRTIDKP